MSDSPRPAPRVALVVVSAVAAMILVAGGAVVLSTGVSAPWLVAAAVVLIVSLTWLASPRKK
ncbi:hypothetical protein EDF46_1199 [Frondihabitans sp. PhB188]|uniref:hypothetical protein n=1 Tax=Frondihabitans sp. PhB188 TaxID=2485200 RepID=UPI000F4AD51C|nr:hypothetical protein [Frondihabitans sp. PhB188]ROQ39567.1 hypothetical protein EDF46_1199 [Frondihabitans sp. PhB188]